LVPKFCAISDQSFWDWRSHVAGRPGTHLVALSELLFNDGLSLLCRRETFPEHIARLERVGDEPVDDEMLKWVVANGSARCVGFFLVAHSLEVALVVEAVVVGYGPRTSPSIK
jgi:hypothetical protein